jgi:GT2 family glycosyltransferase
VTIAVPTFNRADLLDGELTALRRQTFADIEIVICENASVDRAATVIESHAKADPRMRVQRNGSNIGAALNFELGLLLARGEYFMWAADDDLWESTYVERLVGVLDTHLEVALACAEAQYILPDGTACPFVPEGSSFRVSPAPRSIAERLELIRTSNDGNLVYGLLR